MYTQNMFLLVKYVCYYSCGSMNGMPLYTELSHRQMTAYECILMTTIIITMIDNVEKLMKRSLFFLVYAFFNNT